jgi:ADP-ribosylglycohydrolase
MDEQVLIDRFKGCVLGAAIGDAMGAPTEFLSLEAIQRAWGFLDDLVPWGRHKAGEWTDDTEMMMWLLQALVAEDELMSLDDVARKISAAWVQWGETYDPSRAPGNSCLGGARRLKQGVPWQESGKPNGNGCGAVMRVAPVGLLYARHPEMLAKVAHMQGFATHQGERTNAAAVATAFLVGRLLLGDSWDEALDALDDALPENSPARQYFYGALDSSKSLEEKLDEYRGWDGGEAFGAALACAAYSDDYADAVAKAINSPGDSDSLGCICGAFMGAKLGASAIPEEWIQKVEEREWLEELAVALYHRFREVSNG